MKVNEIASQIRERIPVSAIRVEDYVSTDNMRPNFGGVDISLSLPPSGTATAYQECDILLSNIRPYFRKTWLATHSGGCNADVLCIRTNPEKCHPRYLYYLFTTDNFVNDYLKSCKGAKMPRGNVQRLLDYEFNLPDLPTQLRIAGILGSLDEKIEVNRKKIAELEALAKAIYDYWFVQFDFPDKNGKPYKSSGGKMVWNEALKREVPEGWEVLKVGAICKIRSGYPFSANSFTSTGKYGIVTIRNVQDGAITIPNEVFVDKYPESMPPEFKLSKGDILMSLTGYVGRVGIVTFENSLLNQRVALILPKDQIDKAYLYCFLRSTNTKNKIENLSTGCAQKNVSPIECENILVSYNRVIVRSFQEIISPVIEKYINLFNESKQLTITRDFLLSLLMNGQVSIKD